MYTTAADAPTPVGWVKKQTFPDGGTYQFAYTVVNGRSTQTDVTDQRGYLRRVTLNSEGYRLSETLALGQPEQQVTTTTRQPGTHFVTSETDALGHQTARTYDAWGNVLTVTRLAGTEDAVTTTYTYDPIFSKILTVTDPLNHTTTIGYRRAWQSNERHQCAQSDIDVWIQRRRSADIGDRRLTARDTVRVCRRQHGPGDGPAGRGDRTHVR